MGSVRRAIADELSSGGQSLGRSELGFLQRAVHGTRDAAPSRNAETRDPLVGELGCMARRYACNSFRLERLLRVAAHADDVQHPREHRAECGLVAGVNDSFGTVPDWSMKLVSPLLMDAVASASNCSRHGVCRIKHASAT